MAAPARGTALLSDNLDVFLSTLLNLVRRFGAWGAGAVAGALASPLAAAAARKLANRSLAFLSRVVLADFRPYLTGGALDGTAGRYSELEIDLFPESAKEVEIFFLNQDFHYEHREPRRPAPNTPEAVLSFDWNEVPVRLSIYSAGVERGSRRGQERARLAQVEALLHDPGTTDSNRTQP